VPSELWYRGSRVSCLDFGDLSVGADGHVPTSPIYVTFRTQEHLARAVPEAVASRFQDL
jgi:hypothetical protein